MSTTGYNKVASGGQTNTTSYNIPENKINVVSYNICLVKTFDRDQTSYNKIQHDKTRCNKFAKQVQHFIQHQSFMMYEMLHSFGHFVLSCCIMLYRVVSCRMKFDCDQTFSLNKCCTIQHFFCFPGYCSVLHSFGHPMQLCCALLYLLWQMFLKTCCIVLYEMLHSSGHPSVKHD